jgi:hypothetical protein
MMEQFLINLNTLLRSNYYHETIIDKIKHFINLILIKHLYY